MIDFGYGCTLGPITDIDPDLAFKWRNSPKIYKWCRQYEPLNHASHLAWFNSLPERQDVKMYTVHSKEILKNIGVCGFTGIDLINRHAEFSIYVGPEYHGNGYGVLALKTLVRHGFEALGLNHIFGETFDKNPAHKNFEKVGFKLEGTRRGFYFRGGKFIDAHLYSILKDEFKP